MKKKILFVLIVLLIIFSAFVVYYGINEKQKDKKNIEITEPYSFVVEKEKKTIVKNEQKNEEIYKSNIIYESTTSCDYELVVDDDSIYGEITIKDGYLYVYDNKNHLKNKISNVLMKSLYVFENSKNFASFYVLSKSGDLYYFSLYELDIEKYDFYEIETNFAVKNFTTLSFKSLYGQNMSNLIVLAKDGNLYEVKTGIQYSDEIVSLNEQYYIYPDNTIANSFGNMIKDNGVYLKIKYYIETPLEDRPFKGINSIIITEDNKLIYAEENSNSIFEYKLKVIDIEHRTDDSNYEYFKIILENGYTIDFKGYCGKYYYLK